MSTKFNDILIINGPNLNLLGLREPDIYGNKNLKDINDELTKLAIKESVNIDFFQTNAEHEIINKIQSCLDNKTKFIIINPGALTHTSVAVRDALLGVNIPFIEVHISNIFTREGFRKKSFLSDIAKGVITGFGIKGYLFALSYAIDNLK